MAVASRQLNPIHKKGPWSFKVLYTFVYSLIHSILSWNDDLQNQAASVAF